MFRVPLSSRQALGMVRLRWQVGGLSESRRPGGRGRSETSDGFEPGVSLRELFVWLSPDTTLFRAHETMIAVKRLLCWWVSGTGLRVPSVWLCLHMPVCVPTCLVNCSLDLFVLHNLCADLFLPMYLFSLTDCHCVLHCITVK